jgi:hypothetical protein
MKNTLAIATAVLSAIVATPVLQAAGDKFEEAVVVRGTAPRVTHGDLALTFSAPVSLPGISLAPGTYVFQETGPNALLVRDTSGKPYRVLMTMSTRRYTVSDEYSILLDRQTHPDAPARIIAIFAPRAYEGREFIYPTH